MELQPQVLSAFFCSDEISLESKKGKTKQD